MQTSLPPLDVLMVWHSFMLNPHQYASFSKTISPHGVGDRGMPWELVSDAIAAETPTFILSEPQVQEIEFLGLSSDLLKSLKDKTKTDIELSQLLSAEIVKMEEANDKLPGYRSPTYDLAAAVTRQADFALTMTRFGWVHSPYSDSILRRAIIRYCSFLRLFQAHAGTGAVPALDIDLVWHTHQLSPAQYFRFSTHVTDGRFINHNDHLEQKVVSSSMERTKQLYKRRFGEKYLVCHSWFCEAARLRPDGVLPKAEMSTVQRLIRNTSLLLPVKLDLAECSCHNRELCGDMSPWQRPEPEGVCGGCGGCGGGGSRCLAA
ncbi:hypothetical protein QBC41DRAFT_305082 [Cercophora samala]|uniref:Uncharacterized protein n=1 Tax=Cercophora samala TaxID=330535 RepID=A0AA39Z9C8_9PEZI|nr:hypothetical protein QBC41DRAFT_305082 [Cercophora samala]